MTFNLRLWHPIDHFLLLCGRERQRVNQDGERSRAPGTEAHGDLCKEAELIELREPR